MSSKPGAGHYTCLLHELPREKIDSVYQSFTTGAAKRDLSRHLAQTSFKDRPELKETLEWLHNATSELSGLRNAIVHADYRFDGLNGPPGLRVSPSGDHNKKPNRFAKVGAELATEIQKVIDQLDKHIADLDDFRLYLVQNFPKEGQQQPMTAEELAKIPPHIRASWPRELLTRVELPKPAGSLSRTQRRKGLS